MYRTKSLIHGHVCLGKFREKKDKTLSETEPSEKMEVNLELSLVHVPETESGLLPDVSKAEEMSQKVSKLVDYIKRLEEEKKKIDGFKRELPISMFLVKNAIGKLKEEAMQCTEFQEQLEIEEFLSFKGNRGEGGGVRRVNDLGDKTEWMSSVQLWSSDINFDHQKQDSVSELKLRRQEDDQTVCRNPFQLYCNYRNRDEASVPSKDRIGFTRTEDKEVSQVSGIPLMIPALRLDSCKSKRNGRQPKSHTQAQNKQQPPHKKPRRSWSADLHRLFLDVLKRLGGSRVATPKQIRQLMRVDDLTNDEIKSHLQKYRIYLRRYANDASPENRPWLANHPSGDNSNAGILQRNSSRRPLPNGPAKDIFITGGNSLGMGAEEDARSDSHSWNGKVYFPRDQVDVQSFEHSMNFSITCSQENQLINMNM